MRKKNTADNSKIKEALINKKEKQLKKANIGLIFGIIASVVFFLNLNVWGKPTYMFDSRDIFLTTAYMICLFCAYIKSKGASSKVFEAIKGTLILTEGVGAFFISIFFAMIAALFFLFCAFAAPWIYVNRAKNQLLEDIIELRNYEGTE